MVLVLAAMLATSGEAERRKICSPLCGHAGNSGSLCCSLFPQPSQDAVNYLYNLINLLLLSLTGCRVRHEVP